MTLILHTKGLLRAMVSLHKTKFSSKPYMQISINLKNLSAAVRAATAAKIIAALSRPSSSKETAWTDDKKLIDEDEKKKKKKMKSVEKVKRQILNLHLYLKRRKTY
jgi:hypothetical protein